MKNLQNVPVVKASNTIEMTKGFYQNEDAWQFKNVVLNGLFLLSILFLLGVGFAIAAPTALKGGAQHVPTQPTGGKNNECKVDLVNNTGSDLWDVRITLYKQGKIKSYEFTPANLAPANNAVNNAKTHVIFNNKVPKGGRFQITLEMTAPNDSIAITPTDILHADLMVDLPSNSVVKNKYQPEKPMPGTWLGGKQSVHIDPSNFPAVTFVNQTGQKVCDMKIMNARDAAGNAVKFDEVYVDDKKVDSAQCNGSKNFKKPPYDASSAHINFPCVDNGSSVKITVKYKGIAEVIVFDLIPTNKDSADIIVSIQPAVPNNTDKKLPKRITFGTNTDGSTIKSGLFSFTVVNLTGQNVCDLILVVPDGKKIAKVKVNDNEWKQAPGKPAAGKVHVFAGTNPCIPNGDKITVTVWLESGEVAYVDWLPTNSNNEMIYIASINGTLRSLDIPNNYSGFGLTGRSVALCAINESCSPISQITFTSPNPGIQVTNANSSLPFTFSALTHTIYFVNPVPTGSLLDVHFVLNSLLPYSPTDSFPYTTVEFFSPGSDPFIGWPFYSITPSSNPVAFNGGIDLMTDGNPLNTFLWSNGATTEDLQNIGAGIYTVTLNNGTGCIMHSFEVTHNMPSVEILPYSTLCNMSFDGGGWALVSGMVEPLTFLWDNGETTRMATALNAGIHSVIVTDATGYVLTASTTVTEPAAMSFSASILNPSCFNSYTGSIAVTVTGGTEAYKFHWSNSKTTASITNIKAGNYALVITDGFGCMSNATFNVTQPSNINIGLAKVDVSCAGSATGKLTANVSGGTSPYSYFWSNGVFTKVNKNLPVGIYTVTLSDANGCTRTKSSTITQNPPLMVNTLQIGPNMAMANVAGGVSPYTFLWNTVPPQMTPQATNLIPGMNYLVQVMDSKGCMQTGTIHIAGTPRIGSETAFAVNAFPNPVSDVLNIGVSNATSENYSYQLMDVSGRVIFESNHLLDVNQKSEIDMTSFADGIYSLKVISNDSVKIIKVVLSKK